MPKGFWVIGNAARIAGAWVLGELGFEGQLCLGAVCVGSPSVSFVGVCFNDGLSIWC